MAYTKKGSHLCSQRAERGEGQARDLTIRVAELQRNLNECPSPMQKALTGTRFIYFSYQKQLKNWTKYVKQYFKTLDIRQ